MSVLGTSLYEECKYFLKDDRANYVETRFVQEASIRLLCKEWNDKDQIVIFTTEKAFKDNYSKMITERVDMKAKEKIPYSGLEKVLEGLTLKIPFKSQAIKEGNSEKEIWSIFETMYAELKENDEIYFDITHSFRYLPMLLLILLSYSELLKKTKIKTVTYGNYEAAKKNDGFAPIMDLLPLVLLKDWSLAVNNFETFGEVGMISTLCRESLRPVLRKAQGKDAVAKAIDSFSKDLPKFVKNIQTCRGKEIIGGELPKSLMRRIENIQETSLSPLNPIFSRLKLVIKRYSDTNNVKNGLAAVDWCIQNGLLQQGFTLLQETIISMVCDSEELDFTDRENREIVSQAFTIKMKGLTELEWEGECRKEENKSAMFKLLNNDLLCICVKEFYGLTQQRNDINHAGMLNSSSSAEKFETNLKDLYCKILTKTINL